MDDDTDMDSANSNLLYPKIENIYSNIANIKTEALDYEDNDFNSTELLDYDSSNDYYKPIPNKIIIGSKPPTKTSNVASEPSTSSNWLDRKQFQCDQCPMSFSSQAQLNSHSTSHSFLVARPSSRTLSTPKSQESERSNSFSENSSNASSVSRNSPKRIITKLKRNFPVLKATLVKDQSKKETKTPNKGGAEKVEGFICTHCNIRFPDEAALIRHTYELIPDKKFKCTVGGCYQSFNTIMELNAHKTTHVKKTNCGRKFLQCHLCSLYLLFPTALQTHLLKCHNITEFLLNYQVQVKFNGKCPYCPKSLPDHRLFNKHIAKKHYKLYISKKSVKNRAKPSGDQKTSLVKTKFSELCKKLSAKNMPVPKKALYKCNKCQIHFVTCTMANKHSRQCALIKGDWKCNTCRRTFTQEDRNIHTLQHKVTDKFEVHTVNERTFSQVLCKCPECELFFSEVDFFNHVATGCTPSIGLDCDVCKLSLHRDSRAIHRSTHKKYNYTRDAYIIVEYVGMKKERKIKRRVKSNVLRYCSNCKTNQFRASNLKYHLTGECKKIMAHACQICGLLFTINALDSHKIQCHQKDNWKLSDFTFIRIQDNKVIAPPIPEYFKCPKCDVTFVSNLQLKLHNCQTYVSTKCKLCSKKYDDLTYKLHLSFHEYKMPATVTDHKAEKSVKIFSCSNCNIGFDSYDSLIYHCQNHFTDTQTVADNHCKACNLKFYESHVSHGADFKIFHFQHDSLLTDEWLNGFGSLSIDEIDKILSKSVHGDVRNVRLQLLKDGPSERSLYKCAQCELYFNVDSIADHAKEACTKTPRYSCSSCHAVFNTALCLRDHLDIHVIYGDDIDFREIIFNNTKDKELNEILRTGRTKESLKFRKCAVCELLVKKNDYQRHIAAHNEAKNISPGNNAKNAQVVNKAGATQKKFAVYKCKHCKAAIMNKVNIVRHACWWDQKTVVCEKCSLQVRICSLNQHNSIHLSKPNFVTSNITVIEFESGIDIPKARKRRYSELMEYKNPSIDNRHDNKCIEKENRNEDKSIEADAGVSIPQYASSPYGTRQRRSGKVLNNDQVTDKETPDVQVLGINDSVEASSLPLMDKWVAEKNNLYQCDKCYLCFMNKKVLIAHLFKCLNNSVETPLTCNQCDLTFHPSLTTFHEKLHELAKKADIEDRFYLFNISTKGFRLLDENNWIYKCKVCDLHYMTYQSVENHILSDHKMSFEIVTCDICDLKFTTHTFPKHKRIHHGDKKWSKENTNVASIEIKIIGSGDICLTTFDKEKVKEKEKVVDNENIKEENVTSVDKDVELPENGSRSYDGVDNHLFKCTTCGIHYINRRTLEIHVKCSEHNVSRSQCVICGLDFGPRTVIKHMKVQHNILRLARKDLIIESLTGEILKDDPDVLVVEGNENNEKDTKEKIDSVEMVPPSKIEAVEDNYLYKCVKCSIHFLYQNQLLYHIASNHEQKDLNDCDVCGLRFEVVSLPNHKSKHHDDLKLTVTDFEIIDETKACVTDTREGSNDIRSESCAPSIDTDDMPMDETENITDEKKSYKKTRLYQCKDCRVCIRKAQTKTHICYSDIRKKQCILCTLFFSRSDYFKHIRLHNRFKLSRKDFLVVRFGRRMGSLRKKQRIYKCQSCSIHFLSLITLEWHMNKNHKSDTVPCNVCGLDFAKFSIDRHVKIHHNEPQSEPLDVLTVYNDNNDLTLTRDSKSSTDNTNRASESPPKAECVIKLFKCIECDVHFLTQSSYYKHLYKHEPLDQTEFMACKMCELQFLTESLAAHLKSHKDKIFSLDKVLTESFQPDTNQSVVQSHIRVGEDRHNFKQVSTTTRDETVAENSDEQQSTVDSTSKIDIELPNDDVGTQ